MLSPNTLAAKRHERTMTSRSKAKAKARRFGLQLERAARNRERTADWLSTLGNQQKEADAIYAKAQQAREASRAKASNAPGFIGRVKAFFQRRTP